MDRCYRHVHLDYVAVTMENHPEVTPKLASSVIFCSDSDRVNLNSLSPPSALLLTTNIFGNSMN